MTSKTIEIDEHTYNQILQKKRENETVSEAIERLLGIKPKKKSNIMKYFGIWKDLPQEYFDIIETAHKEIRADMNKRFI